MELIRKTEEPARRRLFGVLDDKKVVIDPQLRSPARKSWGLGRRRCLMPAIYLLDTYIPIKVSVEAEFRAMPARVRRILEDPEAELLLNGVSEVEISIKNALGKTQSSQGSTSRCLHERRHSYLSPEAAPYEPAIRPADAPQRSVRPHDHRDSAGRRAPCYLTRPAVPKNARSCA